MHLQGDNEKLRRQLLDVERRLQHLEKAQQRPVTASHLPSRDMTWQKLDAES